MDEPVAYAMLKLQQHSLTVETISWTSERGLEDHLDFLLLRKAEGGRQRKLMYWNDFNVTCKSNYFNVVLKCQTS